VYVVNQDLAVTDFIAWFMRSPVYLSRAPIDEVPGQLPRIRKEEVGTVEFLRPPLDAQREIAKRLNAELAAVLRARAAAEEQLKYINALPSALLRRGFEGV
jgi:restriction endonuclease S subunit